MEGYDITEVLPGLYRIPVPLVGNPLKELNSYFFKRTEEKGSRNLLVDTGFRREECIAAIREGVAVIGADLAETDILLTHIHGDHIANAPYLKAPDAKMYIGRRDAMFHTEKSGGRNIPDVLADSVARMGANRVDPTLLAIMQQATFPTIISRELPGCDFTFLEDGQELKAGRYTLKAVMTPGHTPGHLCFQVEGTGAMLLGDHVLFDITPNITQWPGVEDSLGDYLDSLEMIDAYPVTIPLPGHRHAGDFHGRIREIREHHRRRIEECRTVIGKLCGADPGRAYLFDIAGHMTWKIRSSSWETFPPMQMWFALGECLSHIDYLKKRGLIREVVDDDGYFCYMPGC